MKQGVFIWSFYVVLKAGRIIIRDGHVHRHEFFMDFIYLQRTIHIYIGSIHQIYSFLFYGIIHTYILDLF